MAPRDRRYASLELGRKDRITFINMDGEEIRVYGIEDRKDVIVYTFATLPLKHQRKVLAQLEMQMKGNQTNMGQSKV